MKKLCCLAVVLASLAGCASNDEKARELELLASNRAGILSAGLPVEHGPLKVMKAIAKKNVIEIMMIYNDTQPGAKPANQLMATSLNTYCRSPEIREQLEKGLLYKLELRNSRGQLVANELVSAARCDEKIVTP